ncbi:hypothetical protein C0J52_08129 [Blattella germanica]|nr:hypothetical protein C0J52_08129 [Blattella germanica]
MRNTPDSSTTKGAYYYLCPDFFETCWSTPIQNHCPGHKTKLFDALIFISFYNGIFILILAKEVCFSGAREQALLLTPTTLEDHGFLTGMSHLGDCLRYD